MALNEALTAITEVLAKDLAEGRGSRQPVGAQAAAFGWTEGLPVTLAEFVDPTPVVGMSFPTTVVSSSATPPAVVAPGGPKPNAITLASDDIKLKKFSGMGVVKLEDTLSARGLLPAVQGVLGAGCLLAFEADAMAVLLADAGGTATGATWLEAITTAQGQVVAMGGNPGVLVVAAADYSAVVLELGGSAGFVTDPKSPVGSLFGSLIHVSPKAPAGKAFVLDPAAVAVGEQENSPIVIVDPYSASSTNEIRIVGDLLAVTTVVVPDAVVAVTGPAAP